MFKILNTFKHAFNMLLHKFGVQIYSGLVMTMTSDLSEISKLIQDAQGELILEQLNRNGQIIRGIRNNPRCNDVHGKKFYPKHPQNSHS